MKKLILSLAMSLSILLLSSPSAQSSPLVDAVIDGNVQTVERLLKKGADANAVSNIEGATALMLAADLENLEIVELLLNNGADVHTRNARGKTALMFAAAARDVNVVNMLIDGGANVNAKLSDNTSALIISLIEKKFDIAKALIARGADVNIQMEGGISGLHIVAHAGKTDMVKFLLKHGADTSLQDSKGKTALDYAVDKKRNLVANILREHSGVKTSFKAGGYVLQAEGNPGDLSLSLKDDKFKVSIETYNEGSYNTCSFSGFCTQSEEALICVDGTRDEIGVVITQSGESLIVSDEYGHNYCGANAYLFGKYDPCTEKTLDTFSISGTVSTIADVEGYTYVMTIIQKNGEEVEVPIFDDIDKYEQYRNKNIYVEGIIQQEYDDHENYCRQYQKITKVNIL